MRRWINKFWEKRGYTEETQEMLNNFFVELHEGSMVKIGQVLGSGCSLFIMLIMMWMPYQGFDEDFKSLEWCFFYFSWCAVLCYLTPYLHFKEENKLMLIDLKVKLLPVPPRHLLIYRFRKLVWFCMRVFLVGLVGQIFFALVIHHGLVLENVLNPLILGMLMPVIIGALCIIGAQIARRKK